MPEFIVGIDLGTTNTVVAAVAEGAVDPQVELAVVPMVQIVPGGAIEARPLLPSTLYAPSAADPTLAVYATQIGEPWIVGEAARQRAAEVSGRAVVSAKSWLPHTRVDRLAPILPWGADEQDVPRISPVDASATVLRHVRRAWDARHPTAPLVDQSVVLTVPASFDEVARALTLEAARRAGFVTGQIRLLEEPQAAFLDWMRVAGETGLAALLDDGDGVEGISVLVCDVGGGTTDLSLMHVRRDVDAPLGIAVDRVAVGDHLLLGGDNLDLAIAHHVEQRFVDDGQSHLPPSRFSQLVAAARATKERMLADGSLASSPITLLGSGSRLIGGHKRVELERPTLERLIEPFFPSVSLDDERTPARVRAGLLTMGLPYAQEPAITRHVARFLARHLPIGKPTPPLALLLNGGVFRAPLLVSRTAAVVAHMLGRAPYVLPHTDPDLAVARGAVGYALSLSGVGRRIGGGSARSFFIRVGTEHGDALVCVLPRGSRHGERLRVDGQRFVVTLGKLTRYDLYASSGSSTPARDVLEAVVPILSDDEMESEGFVRLPPLAARVLAHVEHATAARESIAPPSLKGEQGRRAQQLPVALEAELSEVGTLDLHLVDRADPNRRFRLTFELVAEDIKPRASSETPNVPMAGRVAQAIARIEQAFPPTSKLSGEIETRWAKDLMRDLEKVLGDRGQWPLEILRMLFDALRAGGAHRRRSAEHERAFWNLAGYCIRPGFGAKGDAQRLADLAPMFGAGLYFPKEANGFRAWWVAWRRAAPGLDESTQSAIRDMLDPFLEPEDIGGRGARKKAKNVRAEPFDEVLLLVSSLERVPAERRAALAGWMLDRTWTSKDPNLYAAVGRLAARVPLYASAHHVVSPRVAEGFLEQLIRAPSGIASVPYAIAQVARKTGDRARDIGDNARNEALRALTRLAGKPSWSRMVSEVVVDEETRREALAEALPIGLRLAAPEASA
jgi:molecular chaperone DnaK (HSP70)